MKLLKSAIIVTLLLSVAGCTSNSDANKALTAMGMTDIETHGYAWFACSEDDSFATKFTATNPQGQRVSGAVCSSWLKGSTVRFD